MNHLRETCHCTHDKSSHYREFGAAAGTKHGACLCQGCDCSKYVNEFEPKPRKPPERPNHRGGCPCPRCKEWRASVINLIPDDRPTDPYPWGSSPPGKKRKGGMTLP